MYSFLFLGCHSSLHDMHVFEYHHIKQLLHCINFSFLSIYRMASAAFDIELESFITMLYTCEAAVYLDTSPSRKDTLKKYLVSALVPISTICKVLGFVDSEQLETHGESIEEICQKLLQNMRFKIEYLKSRNKNEHVIKSLRKVTVEKINPKLKQYINVSNFHGVLIDDEL